MRKQKYQRIYTLDLETDPFQHGRIPQPFVAGLYDGETFRYFWGDDCIAQARKHIETLEPGIIYAHNGGRFDFFYTLDWMTGPMFIVANRIISAEALGKHELRDSFAIMPFPLKSYQKDEINYEWMERKNRNHHRDAIVSYLQGDCVYLWNLCAEFQKRFKDRLTIGATALSEFRKHHEFSTLTERQDRDVREEFYHGGRVECFEKGIITSPLRVYDVNSMYPSVMRNYSHPIGMPSVIGRKITDKTAFLEVTGENLGAFTSISKTPRDTYTVTIHEWKAGLDTGMFRPQRIIKTIDFEEWSTFDVFVDHFYDLRKKAKIENDAAGILFFKYILNSCYGKFGQNPEGYKDYKIDSSGKNFAPYWTPSYIMDNFTIWSQPSRETKRYNVAISASITGAARAVLMRAISQAKGLVYCDTDSLICESMSGEIDDSKLGAWKLEETGDTIAIAGKKMYALFRDGECVKMASKGVKLTPEQIRLVASGEEIIYKRDAPTYRLGKGDYEFLTRKVAMT